MSSQKKSKKKGGKSKDIPEESQAKSNELAASNEDPSPANSGVQTSPSAQSKEEKKVEDAIPTMPEPAEGDKSKVPTDEMKASEQKKVSEEENKVPSALPEENKEIIAGKEKASLNPPPKDVPVNAPAPEPEKKPEDAKSSQPANNLHAIPQNAAAPPSTGAQMFLDDPAKAPVQDGHYAESVYQPPPGTESKLPGVPENGSSKKVLAPLPGLADPLSTEPAGKASPGQSGDNPENKKQADGAAQIKVKPAGKKQTGDIFKAKPTGKKEKEKPASIPGQRNEGKACCEII